MRLPSMGRVSTLNPLFSFCHRLHALLPFEEVAILALGVPFPETPAWMEDVQQQHSHDDHGPFKSDKETLVFD